MKTRVLTEVSGTGLLPETRLRFWGVRGSIASPGPTTVGYGGNTSCVEVRTGGEIIVLDAGTGARPLGAALIEEKKGAPLEVTFLITHTHWDHIQGFPFFAPAYEAGNRVRIFGYEGARAGLGATLTGQMESPYFPIPLADLPAEIVIEELKTMEFSVGKMRVEACLANHPGKCVGYKLHTANGAIVYLPDHETCSPSAVPANAAAHSAQEQIAAFVRDAEVLIIDSQYTAQEYAAHINWGHGCIDDVVRLAVGAQVRRLYTFHHDPAHDDAAITAMVASARRLAESLGSTVKIEAAREGDELVLDGAGAAAADRVAVR